MTFDEWWDTTKTAATPETFAGWEHSCRQAWNAALKAAAPTVVEPLTRDVVAEIVRNHLTATYHCTRVWEAWSVGTMTEDDFELASESDMAEEIADAILTTHPPRTALTDGEIYTAYITAANQTLRPQDEKLALAFARAVIAAEIGRAAQ